MRITNPDTSYHSTSGSPANPGELLQELAIRINDQEILNQIERTYDFSGEAVFRKSFLSNHPDDRTLLTDLRSALILNSRTDFYSLSLETIVLQEGRPSLIVRDNEYEIPKNDIWKQRLDVCRSSIVENIPSVGRIELQNHPTYAWVGTGWLYENTNLLFTNRHVADVFSQRNSANELVFRHGPGGREIKANVDFREEHDIDFEIVFRVKKVVYLSANDQPDVAILEIDDRNIDGHQLPHGLKIRQSSSLTENSDVYTLGYPSRDSRILDTHLMDRIFSGIYDVKRLAPGKLTKIIPGNWQANHDCSTLGGCSGAPVISLETGEVVALHYGGIFKESNWAVTSDHLLSLVRDRL